MIVSPHEAMPRLNVLPPRVAPRCPAPSTSGLHRFQDACRKRSGSHRSNYFARSGLKRPSGRYKPGTRASRAKVRPRITGPRLRGKQTVTAIVAVHGHADDPHPVPESHLVEYDEDFSAALDEALASHDPQPGCDRTSTASLQDADATATPEEALASASPEPVCDRASTASLQDVDAGPPMPATPPRRFSNKYRPDALPASPSSFWLPAKGIVNVPCPPTSWGWRPEAL